MQRSAEKKAMSRLLSRFASLGVAALLVGGSTLLWPAETNAQLGILLNRVEGIAGSALGNTGSLANGLSGSGLPTIGPNVGPSVGPSIGIGPILTPSLGPTVGNFNNRRAFTRFGNRAGNQT